MTSMHDTLDVAVRLGVAALGGLAVGIEREWSMQQGRHRPHFAGTRTFLFLGLLGALGAELYRAGLAVAGAGLVIAAAALIIVAYAITSRQRDVGGTTEVAGLIVLAGGVLAGLGRLTLASGLYALTTMILIQKSQFHLFVAKIRSHELVAAIRFAVLALVIFPLLPSGPLGPGPGLRPQELWALVLIFSGLSFVSFIALRFIGMRHGHGLIGLLGGFISSTAVTLNFARESREQPALGRVLAVGVIAACSILPLRVVLLTAALNPAMGWRTLPYMLVPFLVGLLMTGVALQRRDVQASRAEIPSNPLRLGAAMQMALAFQVVLYITDWARGQFGSRGLFTSAGFLGLTDVDALIYSMFKLNGADGLGSTAAKVLAIGVLSNTLFKLGIALVVGRGSFRTVVGLGLVVLALASVVTLLVL